MAPWLTDTFEALRWPMDVEIWLEPFGGGAGAALTALATGKVPEAWIVEANPALAAFWTTVMNDGPALARSTYPRWPVQRPEQNGAALSGGGRHAI
jgi:DNA adenine methylase